MTTTKKTQAAPAPDDDQMRQRARRLGFWGLVAHFEKFQGEKWLEDLLRLEEEERQRRSLERRIKSSRLGRFKPMGDFDWKWPKLERELVEDLFRFEFLTETANVILVGPNGVGKTMIAKNLAHQAVLRGHTARFTSASELLNDLVAQESGSALTRRLRQYCQPAVLVIDELGYLSSSSRHADLLFEVVTRRYQDEKPIVLTTNKPFAQWNEVFPSAGCVVTLVDRLIHRAEIVRIDGKSYRLKEAQERRDAKAKARAAKRRGAVSQNKSPRRKH